MENLVEAIASDVAPQSHPAPPTGREELRLALAMRGGVSLAVWIGGAVAEIEQLRRAGLQDRSCLRAGASSDPQTSYGNLLKLAGYSGVTVDVLAGASAGGLNGAVYAAAQCHGFDVAELRNVWLRLGDIETSSRGTTSGRRAADHAANGESSRQDAIRPPSLLDGDAYFYETLRTQLADLILRPPDPAVGTVDQIDLLLSATLYEPQDIGVQINRLTRVQDGGSAALFRFRRGPAGDDLSTLDRRAAVDPGRAAELAKRLAMAARASSSFPVAFEPARVHLTGKEEPLFDGVFIPPGWPTRAETEKGFDIMDGGVLDNIPIAAAIRSIVDAPADGPTDRWLLYLHPSPTPEPDPETGRSASAAERLGTPRAVVTTAKFLAARLGQESALADMRELQAVNDTVRRRQQATGATFSRFLADSDPFSELQEAWTHARTELEDIWARLEMKAVVTALGQPASGGATPVGPADDGGTATTLPWPEWSEDDQLDLSGQVHSAILRDHERPWHNPTWLGEVVRVLICWASDVGRRTTAEDGSGGEAAGRLKLAAYGLRAALTALSRAQKRHWVRAAWERDATLGLTEWVAATHDSAPHSPADDPEVAITVAAALEAFPSVPFGPDLEATDLLWQASTNLAAQLTALAPTADDRPAAWVSAVLERVPLVNLGDGLRYAVTLAAPIAILGPAPEREIRFGILSGEARSALDNAFTELKKNRKDDKEEDLSATALLRPSDKLCGDDLGNFAAFLSARWRLNDWMWGRLDAAATLVDNLLDPQRLQSLGTRQPEEFLRTAKAAVVGGQTDDPDLLSAWSKLEPCLMGAVESGDWVAVAGLLRDPVVECLQVAILGQELPVLRSLQDELHRRHMDPDGPPPAGWLPPQGKLGRAEVMATVATHDVGRLTMGDLNDHRRVRVLLRATLVAFGMVRPAGEGLPAELGRWAISLVKPLVLIAAFVATSLRRGLFVGAVALASMQATYWRADGGLDPPDVVAGLLLLGTVAAGAAWVTSRGPRFALAALALFGAAGLRVLWSTGGNFAVSTVAALGIFFVTVRRWRRRNEADGWERRMYGVTIALVPAGIAAGFAGHLADPYAVGTWNTDFAVPFLILTAGALVVSMTGTFWMTTRFRFLVAVLVAGAYAGAAVPFWEEEWPVWATAGTRLAAAGTVAILAWVVLADRWARDHARGRSGHTLPRWLWQAISPGAGALAFVAAVYARPGWSHRTWITLAVPATAYALTILATYAEVLTPRPIRDEKAAAGGGAVVPNTDASTPSEPGVMVPAGVATT